MSESESPAETGTGAVLRSLVEVSPFFFLAGMGMVASGALLDYVAESVQVFQNVPSLLILVPALLGLKGNLEMTLGARLGSHANKKELQGLTFWPIVRSNLMAIQCQAITVGSVASVMAIAEHYAQTADWDPNHALLLGSSAITAASLASLLLSSLMIFIVVQASKKGIDPDNITAPIAGMLGDFCTLGIVVLVAKGFWALPAALFGGLGVLVLVYVVVAVLCFVAAYKSTYTREIMVYGWLPVIASMCLSNLSGPISEASIERFSTFARFQVVMNGAGGNLGAIMCSKMSTDLLIAESEVMPSARMLRGPYRALTKKLGRMGHTKQSQIFSDDPHLQIQTSWVAMEQEQNYLSHFFTFSSLTGHGDMARFARMLLLLIVPGQAVFACIVVGAATGWSALPEPLFLGLFIIACLAQVIVLLMAARQLVVWLWRHHVDPDNGASPLICGLGDLVGTSFMTLAFMTVQHFNGEAWPGNL